MKVSETKNKILKGTCLFVKADDDSDSKSVRTHFVKVTDHCVGIVQIKSKYPLALGDEVRGAFTDSGEQYLQILKNGYIMRVKGIFLGLKNLSDPQISDHVGKIVA